MQSYDAKIVLAKACEIFILDLVHSVHAWKNHDSHRHITQSDIETYLKREEKHDNVEYMNKLFVPCVLINSRMDQEKKGSDVAQDLAGNASGASGEASSKKGKGIKGQLIDFIKYVLKT